MEVQTNKTKVTTGNFKKGEEIMNIKALDNKNFTKEDKKDATDFAEILYSVQKLPTEQKVAMQNYIKGAVDVALLLSYQDKDSKNDMARQSM